MSSLADRIRGIVGAGTAAANPQSAINSQSAINPQSAIRDPQSSVLSSLGGQWVEGCVHVEREWKPSARHGSVEVGALAASIEAAAADAPLLANGTDARPPFLFFDLETTGLSGGAGTQAFLVGCGWFDGDRFVARQLVMARPADERPLLERVGRELARAGALVTFNGKSFDAPLLETRYAFHRLAWSATTLPHVDVLHPARQFWRARTRWTASGAAMAAAIDSVASDCSLVSLERQLLGHRRTRDVPGFEIPARYFQFVRSGDARPLAAVLEHNRLDLLTLAALTARLLTLARLGPDAAREPREALALGRLYARAGRTASACAALERALAMSRAPKGAYDVITIEALRALAHAYRRAREFDAAARCWQRLLETRGCPELIAREASEALAIHHEHRRRDFAAARTFASMDLGTNGPLPERWIDARRHRIARLDRKLGQQQTDGDGLGF